MKTVNVYNSSCVHHVTILINNNPIVIKPWETVQVRTNTWFGYEEFKLSPNQEFDWKEVYTGRHNENLILRVA